VRVAGPFRPTVRIQQSDPQPAREPMRGRFLEEGGGGVGIEVGERVRVRAYKADGTCYRRWCVTVEAVERDLLVTVAPAGHRLEGVDGVWRCEHVIRTIYWPDRWYSLLEVYTPDGRLEEITVNVSSPVTSEDSEIRFTDYELDVSRRPPEEPRILDEDEF